MAKAFTKSQTAATLADLVGVKRRKSVQCLDELAQLAYSNANNTFTLPSIDNRVLVGRKDHAGRNPTTGDKVTVKARRVVKLRLAKAASK
jgi:DNA-binding protein HU-beta